MTIGDKYLAGQKKDEPPKDRSHPRKPPEEKHRKVARDVLRKGKTVYESLLAAGYSVKQSKKGLQRIEQSYALKTAFREEAKAIEEDAKKPQLFPSEQALEGLIMHRLESNIVKGTDRAVQSCKLAGSHRKLNLWEVDRVTGAIVINVPSGFMQPIRPVPEDDE